MNCLEFRRKLAVEPATSVADFVAHRESCARCADAHAQALVFEGGLKRALSVPVPEGLADRILLRQTTEVRTAQQPARSRFAGWRMAAALALAVGAAGMLLLNPSRDALASEAVAHLSHEPYALAARAEIDGAQVRLMFAERGVTLVASPGRVNYINHCRIAGDRGVHLVVQEASGPVTVYFLPKHRTEARKVWERDGVKGRTIPVGEGTLVLLGSHDDGFDQIEQAWQQALGAG